MNNLSVGNTLQGGKYKIIRFISSGGFGCTYEAEHTLLHKRVAIKEFFVKDFCNRDGNTMNVSVATESKRRLVDKLKRKFCDEAVAISKFSHPNIVKVHDVFEEHNTYYYVMDYLKGGSLKDVVKQKGRISESEATAYILQLCDALGYVHSKNCLHLDIKPGNIMLDEAHNIILIDFGASKQYDEESGENTSSLLGKTPGYAPIEQMGNNVSSFTPATDIYSVGATFFNLLSGATPPEATTLLEEGFPTNTLKSARINKALILVIEKAMSVSKKDRYQTISDMVDAIRSCSLSAKEPKDVIDESTRFTEYKVQEEPEIINVEPSHLHVKDPSGNDINTSSSFLKNKSLLLVGLFALLIVFFLLFSRDKTQKTIADSSNQVNCTIDSVDNNLIFTVNGVGFEMINVEGSIFSMGATPEQGSEAYSDEKPVHEATLSDYYIGKTEVTQELWQAVMGSNPSDHKGRNYPVEFVSWDDIQEFLSKLNNLTGQTFKLPTEAQWEYAARGGKKSRGYKYSGSIYIDDVAWYDKNSGDKTHIVATKQPNELGIYDMSGNVYEWCCDWYGDYNSASQTDPSGAYYGSYRVRRGGSCWDYPEYCRVSHRNSLTPDNRSYLIGFRIALAQ